MVRQALMLGQHFVHVHRCELPLGNDDFTIDNRIICFNRPAENE